MFPPPFWKNRSSEQDEPQLLPLDGSGNSAVTGEEEDPDCQDIDLAYEDALLDAQMRRFMRAEMNEALPPLDSFHRVLRAIEGNVHQSPVPRQASTPNSAISLSFFFAELSRAIYRFGRGVSLSRVVSGGLAVMLMLVVLSSNVSILLRGNDQDHLGTNYVPVMSEIRQEATELGIEARRAALEAERAAQKAWEVDPAETWAPRARIPLYVSSAVEHAPEVFELRKE